MASPSSSKKSSPRIRKIGAPVFKPGIGDIYRELEQSGRLRIDILERRAALLAEQALRRKGVARLKRGIEGFMKKVRASINIS